MENPNWTKRRLGRTDLSDTPLGIGGAWLGRREGETDEQVAIDTVLRGLELGMNLFETSGAAANGLVGFSRPSRVEQDVTACFEPIADAV
jgi:aryl-alcohol dehydrogenase-like predicted oxidoreductase